MQEFEVRAAGGSSLKCWICPECECVEVRVTGDLSDELIEQATRPCEFCDAVRRFVDLRGSRFRVSVEKFRQFAEARLGRGGRGQRIAVVTEDPLTYGMFRMASAWSLSLDGELRVFREADEARAWLRDPLAEVR